MAKRRASGEGLLHRRGKRWVARIVIGHAKDGKPIFHHISGKTQKEAKMKLHQALDLQMCIYISALGDGR